MTAPVAVKQPGSPLALVVFRPGEGCRQPERYSAPHL